MAGTKQDTRSRALARLVEVTDTRRRRSGEPVRVPSTTEIAGDAPRDDGLGASLMASVPATTNDGDRSEDEVWRGEELFDDDGAEDGGKRVRIGSLALRPGHLLVVGGALVLAVLVVLGWLLTSRSDVDEVPRRAVQEGPAPAADNSSPAPGTAGPPSSPAPATGGTPSSSPSVLYVHVAGKVAKPGVVELPVGARVSDAIEEAGGARAGVDLRTVNLARPLIDGEQVLVGLPPDEGAPEGPPAKPPGGAPTEDAEIVDLNAATIEQLETLPGVGPVLAQRILETREERGGFGSVDELNDVQGIGEKRYAELKDKVRVS